MSRSTRIVLALALLAGATTLPAWAASSASSASSEGSSASVGSSSTSIEQSSASSSPGEQKAEGPYRIVNVAAADAAGKMRVALKAVGGEHAFVLVLPQETVARAALAEGGVITAKAREYGMQFAVAGAKEPFFLVVDDARFDELKTRVVKS
jgi:hypothetical protein